MIPKKEKEKIRYFNSGEVLELEDFYCERPESQDDVREKQGFTKNCDTFSESSFYRSDGFTFFEIIEYFNEQLNISIHEYWDCNSRRFIFACKDDSKRFELTSRYISLAKDLSIIERNLKYLIDK